MRRDITVNVSMCDWIGNRFWRVGNRIQLCDQIGSNDAVVGVSRPGLGDHWMGDLDPAAKIDLAHTVQGCDGWSVT